MPRQGPWPARAPVRFREDWWLEDHRATSDEGRRVADETRSRLEGEGQDVAPAILRRTHAEADDGTRLPQCRKVYLPPTSGPWAIVFAPIVVDGRAELLVLAFGRRHHPPGSRKLDVNQVAHWRLHGEPPPRQA